MGTQCKSWDWSPPFAKTGRKGGATPEARQFQASRSMSTVPDSLYFHVASKLDVGPFSVSWYSPKMAFLSLIPFG